MFTARRAFLAVPLLLAACSGGGAAPAEPTTGAAETQVAGASDAPSLAPSEASGASPDAVATPAASLSGDLASMLPTEIAGNKMTIEPASDPTRSFMILWNDEQIAQGLLDAIGAGSSEIDVVFSYPDGNTSPNRVSVDAYRVVGADGTALRDGMVDNYRKFLEQVTTVTVSDKTVGGKTTVLLEMPDTPPGQGQYFYNVGDIVFVVSGTPDEWVEDAFSQLP